MNIGDVKIISYNELKEFINALIKAGDVVGPKQNDNWYKFDLISSFEELALDYDVTVLSSKKYLLPQKEELFTFSLGDKPKLSTATKANSLTIVGMHPYDLIAINQLDRLFTQGRGQALQSPK